MNSEPKQVSENSTLSSKWDILTRYDENQRSRVENLKQQIREDDWERNVRRRLNREKIGVSPSTIRKLGRSVLDIMNLKIPAVEKRRNREAMSTAINEIKAEENEKEIEKQLYIAQGDIAKDINAIMFDEENERKDKKILERQMADIRQQAEYKKHNRFISERAQELVERQINEKLLTVDTLEEEALAENVEVEKRSVEYEGSEITVYDLKGLPFSILTHAIDYRHANVDNPDHIGVQTMNKLLDDPSIWTETEEEAKKAEGYGTRNGDARGNTISASYTNSDSNICARVGNALDYAHTVYGFSKLPGDSIIGIYSQDGGTTNVSGHNPTQLNERDLKTIDVLEGPGNRVSYNEVLLRRYDETGKPILPDYIVAEDGMITDTMKKHANYFNIPIINIEKKAYVEKGEKIAMEALESIDENMSYEEISKKIDVARKIDYFNHSLSPLKSVGNGSEYAITRYNRNQAKHAKDEKIADTIELEIKKRLNFIENELKRCIEEVKKANESGEKYKYNSDVLEVFDTSVYEVESDYLMTPLSADRGIKLGFKAPGSMNFSEIIMRFKNSTRNIETRLFDGEHPYDAEEFYKIHPSEREKERNSSAYGKITPLLLKYYDLLRENSKISSNVN